MKPIHKIVVVGANGAMGAGSGALFAANGMGTTLLARTTEKAEAGRERAVALGKGKFAHASIACGSYEIDLERALEDADLVLEAVCEDVTAKREVFAAIDLVRRPDTIVASVTSGLSIAALCSGRSAGFRAHFLGVHLFNPPLMIRGCEPIPHTGTSPEVLAAVRDFLTAQCGREVVECTDTAGFAGNRVGFALLNQVAQLAEEHGVAVMDQLVGPYTGRALAPLATINLVGWDVHAAIVDNLSANTRDTANAQFELPAYMRALMQSGILGRKSGGGFFRREGKTSLALDLTTGEYRPIDLPAPAFVDAMKAAVEQGRHAAAMDILCAATDREAALLRTILLGYVSYALGMVGDVVAQPSDIDRIMAHGFAWAPPSAFVEWIGAARILRMLEEAQLPVPRCLEQAGSVAA